MEQGHVSVGSLPAEDFDASNLLDALKQADTWRGKEPLWSRVEYQEAQEKQRRTLRRKDNMRYKAGEVFDRYAWRYGMRVRVPEQIT